MGLLPSGRRKDHYKRHGGMAQEFGHGSVWGVCMYHENRGGWGIRTSTLHMH